MLDQSDNLNYSFLVVLLFLYLFQDFFFKSLFDIFKKFDIIIYRQGNNWNIKFCIVYSKFAEIIAVAATTGTDGLAIGLASPASVLDVSDIAQCFVHFTSSSIYS